jgi:hypothetical protein
VSGRYFDAELPGEFGSEVSTVQQNKEEQEATRRLWDETFWTPPASLVFGAFGALKHVLTAALLGR